MYTKDGYRTRVPRRPRVWTVYHATGDVFGFGCMAVWMLLLVMACTPPRLLRRVEPGLASPSSGIIPVNIF